MRCIVGLVVLVCHASSIFTACTNLHCILQTLCCCGQRESVLSHLAHYLLLLRVITSVLQHVVINRKKKYIQYVVWKVRKGRELWPVFKWHCIVVCGLETVQELCQYSIPFNKHSHLALGLCIYFLVNVFSVPYENLCKTFSPLLFALVSRVDNR